PPTRDNLLVRWLKSGYLRQLHRCLRYRWLTLAAFAIAIVVTGAYAVPRLGREFMPELEEGVLWVRGMYPRNAALEENAEKARLAREIIRSQPEVRMVMGQLGRPDSGVDPTGFYSAEFFVPLKPQNEWPKIKPQEGWRAWFAPLRHRTKLELIAEMNARLNR